jgi:hypothetical protein
LPFASDLYLGEPPSFELLGPIPVTLLRAGCRRTLRTDYELWLSTTGDAPPRSLILKEEGALFVEPFVNYSAL